MPLCAHGARSCFVQRPDFAHAGTINTALGSIAGPSSRSTASLMLLASSSPFCPLSVAVVLLPTAGGAVA